MEQCELRVSLFFKKITCNEGEKKVFFAFRTFGVWFFCILFFAIDGFAGNIINTNDYPYWRTLSSHSELYGSMEASALRTAEKGGRVRDVMGANALAIILNPADQNTYIKNICTAIEIDINDMHIGTGADSSSVPSHELFHALLALDVIRYDLDPGVLAHLESILEEKIFKLVLEKWEPHGWAMRMLWYKYRNDMENFAVAKKEFDRGMEEHYLPDGVSPAGSGYCIQRFNSIQRSAKNTTLDLMEYMGYNEYYSNPGLIGLHEFMFGYANAPFGRSVFYGDTRGGQKAWDTEGDVIISPSIVKAARFSEKAHQYAMWVLREGAGLNSATLKGYLASYMVMAGPASKNDPLQFNMDEALLAPSRIFHNYAALIEKAPSKDALYLSVQTLSDKDEYHTHYEANAIAMAGYGEILLRNAGYDGPEKSVSAGGVTTPFDFIHAHAESANVLMIGGENHSSKLASGTVEGLVGEPIEYVRASNKHSIKGAHFRDLLFVQPADQVNGYYVVMDHVTTDEAGETVNVVWHPNTATLNTRHDKMEYHSKIRVEKGDKGPRLFSQNKPELTTFLGTPPLDVEKRVMVNQSSRGHYAAEYMVATYSTANKKAAILTVLFPGDRTHSIGEISRIESGPYAGCRIVQGKVHDVALVSDGLSQGVHRAETFQGEDIIYRKSSGKITSWLVKGTSFSDGQKVPLGFKAEASIALYMNVADDANGARGKVTSPGTLVTFYYPRISAVHLKGSEAALIESGRNWATVSIPEGAYALEILTDD